VSQQVKDEDVSVKIVESLFLRFPSDWQNLRFSNELSSGLLVTVFVVVVTPFWLQSGDELQLHAEEHPTEREGLRGLLLQDLGLLLLHFQETDAICKF
jgi:hypothetical protein